MTSSCTSSSSSNFPQRDVSILRHILPINKVTINSNNLFVNFRWTFTFRVEKSYDGTHLAFGGTLDRRCHFKHVSLKQSRFYHCQTSTAHRKWIKVDGSVAIINKKFPYRPTRDVPLLSGKASCIYRVSQEEWTKLRESVPCVELYRYNPKHLYPKLNGYGDNGQRKEWTSCISA